MKVFLIKLIGSWFFTGYLKPAPGTWGTIAGALTFYVATHYFGLGTREMIILTGALFFIAVPICAQYEEVTQIKDPGSLVIDEVVAIMAGYIILDYYQSHDVFSHNAMTVIFFLLFRFFDIIKPYPIKNMEIFFSSGVAVMVDDIMAAIYALATYGAIVYSIQNYV